MKMYVANCTQQVQDFAYRIPGTNGTRRQEIKIGGQILIAGHETLGRPEIDAIVAQHARYGMIAVEDIDRTKPFAGLCYSVDKPVPVEKLRRVLVHNTEVLVERGRTIRQETAVAMNSALAESAAGAPSELEVQVEEVPAKGSAEDVEPLKETVLVSTEQDPGKVQEKRENASKQKKK